MAYDFNGVEMDTVTFNGAAMQRVFMNGTQVYQNLITQTIVVTVGVQANIEGFGLFGGVNTGSRSPTSVDGRTIQGLFYNISPSPDKFQFRLNGNHVGYDFVSVQPKNTGGSGTVLLRTASDVPNGTFDSGTGHTFWDWDLNSNWGLGQAVDVDIIFNG